MRIFKSYNCLLNWLTNILLLAFGSVITAYEGGAIIGTINGFTEFIHR